MWVLKRTDQCPPGSFPYEQTEGIHKRFEATSDLEAQAAIVANFRKANNLPRATKEEAWIDINVFTCQRLGFMPRYCMDTEAKSVYVPPTVRPGGGCGACGAKVK